MSITIISSIGLVVTVFLLTYGNILFSNNAFGIIIDGLTSHSSNDNNEEIFSDLESLFKNNYGAFDSETDQIDLQDNSDNMRLSDREFPMYAEDQIDIEDNSNTNRIDDGEFTHSSEDQIDIEDNSNTNRIDFEVPLDPFQLTYVNVEENNDELDASGIVHLSFDLSEGQVEYEVFFDGMSYVDGDDVEIVQIHLGEQGQDGPSVLTLCNEKKKEGHCREGPGLSVEGTLEDKDLEGPLKHASFDDLIESIKSGESYIYVQTRDHPDGELRGQI
ncbi:MAG: CHRD domain-containing protein [Nitrososphaeraceae archaeon]|nr:CHRD domain-containing protein [Nitrososphaeraceae archaeon]